MRLAGLWTICGQNKSTETKKESVDKIKEEVKHFEHNMICNSTNITSFDMDVKFTDYFMIEGSKKLLSTDKEQTYIVHSIT